MDNSILNPGVPHPLERIPENEAEMIEQVMQIQLEIMKTRQDPAKRGQHPKTQALLRAEFQVLPDAQKPSLFFLPWHYGSFQHSNTIQTNLDDQKIVLCKDC